MEAAEVVERIWARDATLWTGSDEDRWLGWLDEPAGIQERLPEIVAFAENVRASFDATVLLGMGGSSLAPEVLRRWSEAESFYVLDTTHPDAVRRLAESVDLGRTLFVVASKSGTTLETRCHLDYFWEATGARGGSFVAITDPGSDLEALAGERSFRTVFHGEPTIGGRYSALSAFGIVPAALLGVDVETLVAGAAQMAERCRAPESPGVELGLRLGAGWEAGRDKVVFANPHGFGLWLEQLLAESTGKDGKGLVPAPENSPDGADRQEAEILLEDGLGAEFYRWEIAAAAVGRDSRRSTRSTSRTSRRPRTAPARSWRELGTVETTISASGSLDELLGGAQAGDYIAIQAFIDPEREDELAPLVRRARATGCVVTVGLGPRYLHSTGQLHKGGPPSGRFVQVTDRSHTDVQIPGAPLHISYAVGRAGPRRLRSARGARAAHRSRQTGGPVKLGIVGLGRMGGNMTERLRRGGHEVETYARTAPERTADSLVELAMKLEQPRVAWLMIPAGDPTEMAFQTLLPLLEDGDVVVDGGNSYFRDSIRRAEEAAKKGVSFLDVGVSGGIWGLTEGYCIMAGGDEAAFATVEPALATLAPEGGYAHVGPSGAGHFVKMVHNGVEYGLMEAYAEGFELLRAIDLYDLDLGQISALWQQGSVVRSWLLELLQRALEADPDLEQIRGLVQDSGEGRWTVHEAIEAAVPLPAISAALYARFASRQDESFAAKVNAALRNQFGGHAVEAVARAEEAKPAE